MVDSSKFAIKIWSLKRTAKYGSEHYDEKALNVRAATLLADGKVIEVVIDGIRPTWCMEIKYAIRAVDGTPVEGTIHNTIHELAD